MTIFNVFDEPESLLFRFSTIIFFIILYYTSSYFLLFENRPTILIAICLIVFHVGHVVGLKFLHNNSYFALVWAAAIVPLIIFLLFSKLEEGSGGKEKMSVDKSERDLYQKLKQKYEDSGDRMEKEGVPRSQLEKQQAYNQKNGDGSKDFDRPEFSGLTHSSRSQNGMLTEDNRHMENVQQDLDIKYNANVQLHGNVVETDPNSGFGRTGGLQDQDFFAISGMDSGMGGLSYGLF